MSLGAAAWGKADGSNKLYLPSVAFTYGAGPYWKCLVKYGYDAAANPEAHK